MAGSSEAELGQLHERLLGGDPVAPAELAERLLPLLRARLAGWATTVDDPHLVPSAIGLVIPLTSPTRNTSIPSAAAWRATSRWRSAGMS